MHARSSLRWPHQVAGLLFVSQAAVLVVGATSMPVLAQQWGSQVAQVPPVAIPPAQQLGRPETPQRSRGAVFRQGLLEERNLSVVERERDEYEPLGARLGEQWLLFGGVEAGAEFNDNIYSVPSDAEEDVIFSLAPTVRLRSDMPVHQLNMDAGLISRRFSDNDSEDTDSYFLSGNGRLDVSSTVFAFGRAGAAKLFEERTSPNDINGTEPTEFNRFDAIAGIGSNVLRLSYQFDLTWRRFDYDDVSSTGGAIDNDSRDVDLYIGSGRVGWEWSQGFVTYLRGAYNARSHFSSQPIVNRDSTGYDVGVGAVLSRPEVFSIDGFVGVLHQDFDAAGFDEVTEPTFALDAAYNITSRTSLIGNVTRSLEETTVANASSLLQTVASASVEQEILYNLLGRLTVSRIWSDFQDVGRDDDVWVLTGEMKYLINRNLYLSPRVQYSDRSSTDNTAEFEQWRALLVVGAQF